MIDVYLNSERASELWAATKNLISSSSGGSGDTSYLVKAPVGTIVIWSGTADNIPSGWALCDGQDGRPDLRDKFVLGAGITHPVGETGGEEEVILTYRQMPTHAHNNIFAPSTTISGSYTGSVFKDTVKVQLTNSSTQSAAATLNAGNSNPHNNMPPYYALCYIIKIAKDETDNTSYTAGEGITIAGDTISVTLPSKSLTLAEYNALTEEEKQADIQYIITDDNNFRESIGEVYSTEEIFGGIYINKKPWYKKTIVAENGANGVTVSENVDEIINAYGVARNSEIVYSIPMYAGAHSLFTLHIQNGVATTNSIGWDGYRIILTVEYTKTTD